MKKENLIALDKKLFYPGQRVIDFGDGIVLPVGIGGNALPAGGGGGGGGGGSSVDFFKCTDVDAEGKTWSGNKAVLTDGVYSFESKVTSGLKYSSVTPAIGKTYTTDALATIGYLWTGDTLNTDKTRFLLMPSRSNNEIKDIATGSCGATYKINGSTVVNPDSAIVFTGGNNLEFTPGSVPFQSGDSFVIHLDFKVDGTGGDSYNTLYGDGSYLYLLFDHGNSSYNLAPGGPTLASQSGNNRQLFTLEQWKNTSGQMVLTGYVNGKKIGEQVGRDINGMWSNMWGIGSYFSDTYRDLRGKIWMFAIIEGQPYEGKDFTPPYIPEA